MAIILSGKHLSEKLLDAVKGVASSLPEPAKLVAVQVGQGNGAGDVYIKNQIRQAKQAGLIYQLKEMPASVTQAEMEKTVRALNKDSSVTAVIIQQPLPEHLNSRKIVDLIDPFKDAEGVNPCNLGTLFYGDNVISPCTAAAVMELVLSTGVDLYGKEAVVVGHSRIVGKPLSLMLLNKMATVTVCHVATSDKGVLKDHIGRAEVLIVAVGKPHVIKGDWVREGAVVIDVGINKLGNDIVGDVEFDIASKRASFITPVPGGVGPLTTAMLMRNVIELHKIKLGKR